MTFQSRGRSSKLVKSGNNASLWRRFACVLTNYSSLTAIATSTFYIYLLYFWYTLPGDLLVTIDMQKSMEVCKGSRGRSTKTVSENILQMAYSGITDVLSGQTVLILKHSVCEKLLAAGLSISSATKWLWQQSVHLWPFSKSCYTLSAGVFWERRRNTWKASREIQSTLDHKYHFSSFECGRHEVLLLHEKCSQNLAGLNLSWCPFWHPSSRKAGLNNLYENYFQTFFRLWFQRKRSPFKTPRNSGPKTVKKIDQIHFGKPQKPPCSAFWKESQHVHLCHQEAIKRMSPTEV